MEYQFSRQFLRHVRPARLLFAVIDGCSVTSAAEEAPVEHHIAALSGSGSLQMEL